MSVFGEYLAELGMNAGKDFLIDKENERKVKAGIQEYVEKRAGVEELCGLAEEVDFQGLSDYLSSQFLSDVKLWLFGRSADREAAKETIFAKACDYSGAKGELSREKAKRVVSGALDVLRGYYRSQIDKRDLFLAVEEIDAFMETLKSGLSEQEKSIVGKVSETVRTESQRIVDEIKRGKEEGRGGKIFKGNILVEKIHGFIMRNYIKERYRDADFSDRDIDTYSDLFKLAIKIVKDGKEVRIDKNIFEFLRKDVLSRRGTNLVKIVGPDGTGKSTFLSILYIYLYQYCEKNGFTFLPFYINLHFYDTAVNDSELNEQKVKDRMYRDLDDFQRFQQENPDFPYVIIIDGNENYFRTTLKTAKYFNEFIRSINGHKKIVCIGEKTNVHSYRGRSQYSFMQVRMQYTFRFRPIHNCEEDKWKKFVGLFASIEGNENLSEPIKEYLEKFDLDEIDLNILSVFKDCYDSDVLSNLGSISDLYKNYCMAYLRDEDDFEDSAKMSYEYFMTNKRFSQKEIAENNREWNLIHQHKTISNFLIAYYFVGKIKDFSRQTKIEELEYLFPMDINVFIKPLINESLETQKLILSRCKEVYKKGGTLARSQALYMMGRLTHKSLQDEILRTLERYYDELCKQIPERAARNVEPGEIDAHFLLRSIAISLIRLGKKDKREAYLKMLLNYPIANQLNRGFHLEYYGDVQRIPDSEIYCHSDDGCGEMDCTYNILLSRINEYLSSSEGTEDLSFQIRLFTLCSLVQARLGKGNVSGERIERLKSVIDKTLEREESNLNRDFKAYLTMLKEDIEQQTYLPRYLYKKLYGIKDIVRSGWEREIKNNVVARPYENVAEHIYYTWMLGMLYLPDEPPKDSEYEQYDKRKILDAVLIHDWAEVDEAVGDAVPEEDTEQHRELEDFRMRVILMHDTYNHIGNMSEYKKMWNVYGKNSQDINGRTAYELDKIQAIYQFYVYLSKGAQFTDKKIESWLNEKNKITTPLGKSILKEVVLNRFEKDRQL